MGTVARYGRLVMSCLVLSCFPDGAGPRRLTCRQLLPADGVGWEGSKAGGLEAQWRARWSAWMHEDIASSWGAKETEPVMGLGWRQSILVSAGVWVLLYT